jgi:hypothetical protein
VQALIALVLALLASGCVGTLDLATDRERTPELSMWQGVEPADLTIAGCARLFMTVSKSGKEGVGVTFLVRGEGEHRCPIEILEARLAVGEIVVREGFRPPGLRVAGSDAVWVYLPFLFDNLSLWKKGVRSAQLVVRVRADGQEKELPWSLTQSP